MTATSGDGASAPRRFPPGFLWGASTSAYQIEGAAHDDGRGQSIWDTYSHTPGKVDGGDTGDIACDSYHRMDEDLALLSELGVGGYRFSIAWPRIQPTGRGGVNERGLDYYRALVAGLRDRGIQPVATVYHWDLPQALEDEGGWAERETAERFAEYAQLVAEALGDQVAMWITMNEPQQAANQGYRVGTHAPGKTDYGLAAAATHHLLLGHGLALQALRSALPGSAPVGLSLDFHPVRPASEDALELAAVLDAEHNRIFLEPVLRGTYPDAVRAELLPPAELIETGDMSTICAPIDFLAVNYYSPYYVRAGDWDDLRVGESRLPGHPGFVNYAPAELPKTNMGWLVEPAGLYDTLVGIDREAPQLPLYITENGCAADDYVTPEGVVDDRERVDFLRGHFDAAWRAIQDGVNLSGYFVWSLMDNFEWARGYSRRFGLYFVDFGTQRRLPKRSAAFYSRVVRTGVLPVDDEMLQPSEGEPVNGDISRPSSAARPVPGAV
ncbi:MAG TPA: GH1 family beta-glucosidase [Solirubrobacteraceae bacterium]|nr:GH1 family beta-glucosidase [Solirubrobacteraceae bacterium]